MSKKLKKKNKKLKANYRELREAAGTSFSSLGEEVVFTEEEKNLIKVMEKQK